MIRSFLIAAAVLAAAGATSAAHAETQVGSCYQPMVASLNGQVVNGGHTLSCAKGTWSQLGTGIISEASQLPPTRSLAPICSKIWILDGSNSAFWIKYMAAEMEPKPRPLR